jgi:hypothetical protein
LTADQARAGAAAPKLADEASIYRAVNYASIGFSYYYPVRFAESSFGGFGMFLPGVTVGANFEMMGAGWRDGDELYRNGPDLPFRNVFAQIEIAFGGGTTWTEKSAPAAPTPPAAPPTPPPETQPPGQPSPPAADQPAPSPPEPPRTF